VLYPLGLSPADHAVHELVAVAGRAPGAVDAAARRLQRYLGADGVHFHVGRVGIVVPEKHRGAAKKRTSSFSLDEIGYRGG